MPVKHATRGRAAAKALFPAAPKAAAPGRHGREAFSPAVAALARSERLRYRSTPFYLKIQGLEGPRPPRYVKA